PSLSFSTSHPPALHSFPTRRSSDLSRPDCEHLVELAAQYYGRLAVLVNNAVLAGGHSKPLLDTLDADWDAMMAVNLRGPFMLCQDRKSTRLNSSHEWISYAVFCLRE